MNFFLVCLHCTIRFTRNRHKISIARLSGTIYGIVVSLQYMVTLQNLCHTQISRNLVCSWSIFQLPSGFAIVHMALHWHCRALRKMFQLQVPHKEPLTWWRHQMNTFFALLALYEGNPPVTSGFPRRCQWRGSLIFFVCTWTNGWANNRDAGDFRRHRAHHDVTVKSYKEALFELMVDSQTCVAVGQWDIDQISPFYFSYRSFFSDWQYKYQADKKYIDSLVIILG